MTIPEPDQNTTPEPAPRRRRFVPRRRGVVIGAAVLGLLLVVGMVAALVGGPGPRHQDRLGPESSFGDVGELGFADGVGPGGPGPKDRRDGPGRRDHGLFGRGLGDDTLLAGTMVSVVDGSIVLTPDGATERTVRLADDARVFGGGNRGVADLLAGERVVLRVDGTGDTATVVAVHAPPARVIGTVTTLNGDQATVVAVNGLSVTADLTGIGQKPVVGDLVVLTGGASGSTLRADESRVLPKTP